MVAKKNKKETLTPKQESFAYLVGYEKLTYSSAYRKSYSCKNMKDQSIWTNASATANSTKVSRRIEHYREQRLKEERRKFSWTISEAEADLRKVLTKNKNDLMRAERENKPAKHATNTAVLQAVDSLNAIARRIEDEENELALRKAKADVELAENKNRILKEKVGDEDDKTIYEITL